MTSTIAGSSSMITILAIRSAENISILRKRKRKQGKNLISVGDFTMEHDPWNLADKIENCLVNGGRVSKRYTEHLCRKSWGYFSALLVSSQRPRRIDRQQLQWLPRLKS